MRLRPPIPKTKSPSARRLHQRAITDRWLVRSRLPIKWVTFLSQHDQRSTVNVPVVWRTGFSGS